MVDASTDHVLLTVPESMLLVLGAEADDFLSAETPGKTPVDVAEQSFRNIYEDILNSILLSGCAVVCAPPYLKNYSAYEKLAAEGLLQIVEQDYSVDLRTQLATHYERAFAVYRELETHPDYSSKVYLEDIQSPDGWRPFGEVELEEKLGDLSFHQQYLGKTLISVTESLPGLFDHHFNANKRFYSFLIEEIVADKVPNDKIYDVQRLVGETPSDKTLFEIMGLEIQAAEVLDTSVPLFSFLPQDLQNFQEVDSSIFDIDSDPSKQMELGMRAAFRLDQADYAVAHAYWKALFEMVDMLHLSETMECPIYMPLNLPANDDLQKSSRDIKEDLRRVYKIYLSERGFTPKIDCIQDLLRLREDKRLNPLREVLGIWQKELSKEDVDGMNFVKLEIEKARTEVKKLSKYKDMGQFIGYASLPMSFVDTAIGVPIGLAMAPVGGALEFFSERNMKKFNWLNFGT